jgi:hypothetical protein
VGRAGPGTEAGVLRTVRAMGAGWTERSGTVRTPDREPAGREAAERLGRVR